MRRRYDSIVLLRAIVCSLLNTVYRLLVIVLLFVVSDANFKHLIRTGLYNLQDVARDLIPLYVIRR